MPPTGRRPLRLGRKRDSNGRQWQTKVYRPTKSRGYFRVAYLDAGANKWRYISAKTAAEANEVFERVEHWLDAGVVPSTRTQKQSGESSHTVAELGDRLVQRLESDGARRRTIEKVRLILRLHINPHIGDVPLAAWDADHSRQVLAAARTAGHAPSTVQSYGSLLVTMVKEAHRRPRWIPLDEDPMEGVKFRAKARHQGQASYYVPPTARPSDDEVGRLVIQLWRHGRRVGRPWYALMGMIAGYSGLRWSELIALRPCDYDLERRELTVCATIEQTPEGFYRETTKSGKTRYVPVTATTHRWMLRRLRQLHDDNELIFPGPNGGPWNRSVFRRAAFVPAARDAGWAMVGDKPTKRGLPRGGSPALPWRNLRHHAATWLHNTAGVPWEEVSHILGHHSVAFTLETYVRRGSESDADTRRRLDRF